MKFYFGIINYNGGAALIECLHSLQAIAHSSDEIWVYDNCSPDGAPTELETQFPDVQFVYSNENLGYAGAINQLQKQWSIEDTKNNSDHIWAFANMDLTFDAKWRDECAITFSKNSNIHSVASLVLEKTDPIRVNSGGVHFYKDLHPQSLGSGQVYDPRQEFPTEIFGPYGAVMVFRSEIFQKLQFDESFFLFYEETEFFLRFHLSNYRLAFNPKMIVSHHRSWATKRYSLAKLYYSERNRYTSIFKLTPFYYWPISLGYTVYRLYLMQKKGPPSSDNESQEKVALPNKISILSTLAKAFLHAVIRLPQTLKSRRDFFKQSNSVPKHTLEIIQKYRLNKKDLSIR